MACSRARCIIDWGAQVYTEALTDGFDAARLNSYQRKPKMKKDASPEQIKAKERQKPDLAGKCYHFKQSGGKSHQDNPKSLHERKSKDEGSMLI